MAFFGFGKKDKKEKREEKKSIKLNRRKYDRYFVENLYVDDIGKVIDISKNGATIQKDKIDKIELKNINIRLKDLDIFSTIKRETLREIDVNFEKEIDDKNIIFSHLKKAKNYDFKNKNIDIKIEFDKNHQLEKNKAVINLMLEIDDPNASIEKFKSHIEALPSLENAILKKANSVESASRIKIKNVSTAITRIGFEEVKKIVYDYINTKITLKNSSFDGFKHFEAFNILKSSIFKKISPLFAFKDIRSEGRSLLLTDTIGIEFLIKEDDRIKKLYKSPKELYSYTTRLYEEKNFQTNFLALNKNYFVNRLNFFKYLYDGYLLAHLNLYPYFEFKEDQSIILSNRKLRFSYVAYITFLALKYILSKDKRSGYILFNRLKKFGLKDPISFINEIIQETNNQLKHIGIDDRVSLVSIPSFRVSISSYSKGKSFIHLMNKIDEVSKEKAKRVALRGEDSFATMKIVDDLINSLEFDFYDMPFCVIPIKNLADDELTLDMFNGFDLIIFKDIEKLPKNLFKDFQKLWRDFEGKIFVTYTTDSMIDFNNKELYLLIRDYIVDIPSLFENKKLYKVLVENSCKDIDETFDKNICDTAEFENEIYTLESIYKKSIDRLD